MSSGRIEESVSNDFDEIHIKLSLGLAPEDSEEILELAAGCRNLSSDKLAILEQTVWEEAFNTAEPYCTFVKAHAVNEDGLKLVGFAYFGKILEEEGFYELYLVAVDESFRELGIGSTLIDEVERQIAAAYGDSVFCELPAILEETEVEDFFEELGYMRQTRLYKFFIPEKGNSVYAKRIVS